MSLRPFLIVVALAGACGPSTAQRQLADVATARQAAQQRPGARQAVEFAQTFSFALESGAYAGQPALLRQDELMVLRALSNAEGLAVEDAPLLIAWQGRILAELGKTAESLAEYERSFDLQPNLMAGRPLIQIAGAANDRRRVSLLCQATVEVLKMADDRLSVIAECREAMNALTPEAEMAWMSPELVDWYQAENAQRMRERFAREDAERRQARREQAVVRQTEQCALGCKETGLRCQNRCGGDPDCDHRCVEINRACLDRCVSAAYEDLGM